MIRTGDVEHSFNVRYSPAADKYFISRDGAPEQVCCEETVFEISSLEIRVRNRSFSF